MIRNYIFTVMRQIRKNKTFSFVNIVGLGVGMAACLLIAQYVYFHLNFDQFHSESDHIYRLQAETTKDGESIGTTISFGPLAGPELVAQSPLVSNYTRFWSINYMNNSIIRKTEKGFATFDQPGVFLSEKNTFEIFNLPIVKGSLDKFGEPNKMVIDEWTAGRYFLPEEDPIGQNLELSGNQGAKMYEVVAVMKNLPENTHLDFNVLLSFDSYKNYFRPNLTWSSGNNLIYYKVSDPTKTDEILATFEPMFEKNAGESLRNYGYTFDFFLESVPNIHLFEDSSNAADFKAGVKSSTVYALGIIAVVILIIAWINYLNLAFVKVFERSKEVGVRRVMGSGNRQISLLFMLEAITINVISFLFALTVAQLTSPLMKMMTDFEFSLLQQPEITFGMLLIVILGSVLTGIYPSVIMKTLNTSSLLTGKAKSSKGSNRPRQVLVSLQFAITFLLVAGTATIFKQIMFMKNAELGINIDQVMVLKAPPGDIAGQSREFVNNFNALKENLLRNSSIKDVVSSGELPGEEIGWGGSLWLQGQTQDQSVSTRLISMGRGFITFFDIELAAGRMFQENDDPWSRGDVIINEKMVEQLGLASAEEAIDKKIEGFYSEVPLVVRGVVKNHHHTSLHNDYDPIAYILSSWQEYYFVKLNIDESLPLEQQAQQMKSNIALVSNEWSKVYTNNPIDYFFLDQNFDQQYEADEKFGKLFTTFSILAILIACLGLFGLTTFMLQKRTKEIGIRKVLGADTGDLIVLLSKSYVTLIVIAFVIAIPVGWKLLSTWLTNYTFRIEIGLWFVYLPLLIVLAIAVLTISVRVLKVAKSNPVDSLRYE